MSAAERSANGNSMEHERDCEDRLKQDGLTQPARRTKEQKEQIRQAREVLASVRSFYLRQPGVTAIDVGYRVREEDARFEDDIAIRVHVRRKLPDEVLRQRGRLNLAEDTTKPEDKPRRKRIAGINLTTDDQKHYYLNGIPVDIVEARYFPSNLEIQTGRPQPNDHSIRHRGELQMLVRRPVNPLAGGLSIGRNGGPAGTLGAVVWDRTDGSACLLGNWHVLAGARAVVGQPCFQPAISDGGEPGECTVGTLKRWIFDCDGDAALSQIIPGRYYSPGEILGLDHPVFDCIEPQLGMKVRKSGRSTGFTRGFIDGIDLTTNIDYGSGVVRYFENQIHIAPRCLGKEVSARGDSGAIWVHNSGDRIAPNLTIERYYAVALHFAGDIPGSPFGEFAVASPIKRLAERLEFSLRPLFVLPRNIVVPQRRQGGRTQRVLASTAAGGTALEPTGAGRDFRVGGPQPDPEPLEGGP